MMVMFDIIARNPSRGLRRRRAQALFQARKDALLIEKLERILTLLPRGQG
jgi:hypothetical protein